LGGCAWDLPQPGMATINTRHEAIIPHCLKDRLLNIVRLLFLVKDRRMKLHQLYNTL
jgi:hypothetical protein